MEQDKEKPEEEEQRPPFVISSHNMELDDKIGGGLPLGSLTLIEGGSGSGKSVFSQQMLYGALLDGFTATLFTSENTIGSLVSQMRKLDLDITDFLLLCKCDVYPMAPAELGGQALQALLSAMSEQHDRSLVIIDSLTSALTHVSEHTVLHFFEECKNLCADARSVMITLHVDGLSDDLLSPIRSLCDVDFRLHTEQDSGRVIKSLEVHKVRGAASFTGAIIGFDVEPGWGMRVVPIRKAKG